MGVHVDEDGIAIIEVRRTERLAWEEVESFTTTPWDAAFVPQFLAGFAPTDYGIGTPTLVVNRTHGGPRVVKGLNGKSALVWFAAKPPEIAQRLNDARPAFDDSP
jgi:hypothetical protein